MHWGSAFKSATVQARDDGCARHSRCSVPASQSATSRAVLHMLLLHQHVCYATAWLRRSQAVRQGGPLRARAHLCAWQMCDGCQQKPSSVQTLSLCKLLYRWSATRDAEGVMCCCKPPLYGELYVGVWCLSCATRSCNAAHFDAHCWIMALRLMVRARLPVTLGCTYAQMCLCSVCGPATELLVRQREQKFTGATRPLCGAPLIH